jgi:hypothetical protein
MRYSVILPAAALGFAIFASSPSTSVAADGWRSAPPSAARSFKPQRYSWDWRRSYWRQNYWKHNPNLILGI